MLLLSDKLMLMVSSMPKFTTQSVHPARGYLLFSERTSGTNTQQNHLSNNDHLKSQILCK